MPRIADYYIIIDCYGILPAQAVTIYGTAETNLNILYSVVNVLSCIPT